tara:strand:- start:309 stop:521 length:213 start_codon:yes stop_codon:yes gene_type:complete
MTLENKIKEECKNKETRKKILDKRMEIEYEIALLQNKLIKFDDNGLPGLQELLDEFGCPKEYTLESLAEV